MPKLDGVTGLIGILVTALFLLVVLWFAKTYWPKI
jgi:hypothetical protein